MNVPLQDLLTTDIGILSLLTIGFIVGMASYIGWYVRKHVLAEEARMAHDPQAQQRR
ncbi:DUF3149 domain-containing protein [Chitinimonas koreensis]|uniref:DUF3149 domain-containing protein n=1 Tax=Chitinimonas koreensis TaxID=356302 RepID=UPI000414F660|nr:DUF3149 domain-containing protein [Chitinimonas koreensis]QNM95411.1 DUF3149 domain-containing protein [Chitinimonas koreensis]